MSSPLTTHVLDTSRGVPAAGIGVKLEFRGESNWKILAEGKTDADGRITDLLKPGQLTKGVYRLTFATAAYFKDTPTFFPFVNVVFEVTDLRHYHVPLLLSPFGYSTYRGT